MDIRKMEPHKADESGVDAVFDMFDELGDRVKRIEVGRGRFLKAFLKHRCFELALPASGLLNQRAPGNAGSHGTLRGTLYGAKVFHNRDLTACTLRVYGQEAGDSEPGDAEKSKHSFELAFRT